MSHTSLNTCLIIFIIIMLFFIDFFEMFKSILKILFQTQPHLYLVLLAETTIVEILLIYMVPCWVAACYLQ